MRTVDFHAHPVPDSFRKWLPGLGIDVIADDGFPLPQWTAEAHLQFMEKAGIDYSVLSLPTPHIHHGEDRLSLEAARQINDELYAICTQHPERFGWTACLPLPFVSGSLEEIRRCLDEKGAAGIKVPTNANGVYLGDPVLDPVMEALNERRAMVILHPCRAKERPANVITGTVAAIYEYPADTTRAVLNMISRRIMTRFPDIRFVVPHCGSFLPYMLQRFSGVSGILASMGMMEQVDAQAEFSRLWFDIAGDPEPVALDMLRMVVPEDHIVFGSDYPHSPAPVILKKKAHFDGNPKYDDIRQKIYAENAAALLEGKGGMKP